jgi:poly(3-hydroxybutyrate) depolymerase
VASASTLGPRLALLGLLTAASGCAPWYGADDPDAVYGDSRCLIETDRLHCAHHKTTLWTGLSTITPRLVLWQVPIGEAPPGGWPAVLLFQGSAHGADTFWDADEDDAFGGFNQGLVTAALLDAGFAVITPQARLAGSGAWETNIPPMADNWTDSGDHRFMLDIFAAIEAGDFGSLDARSLFAAGISSGGYMTSRMDLAYRERFSALAIASASWATCAGPVCEVPTPLDPEHLPTLFLHGEDDLIVPLETMLDYHQALLDAGVETETVIEPGTGHGWIDAAPEELPRWFERHL